MFNFFSQNGLLWCRHASVKQYFISLTKNVHITKTAVLPAAYVTVTRGFSYQSKYTDYVPEQCPQKNICTLEK
jgi:hypothetical protein